MSKPTKIAIVGMSCRFPNADNIENYWALLKEGKDAVSQINKDRFGTDFYQHPNKKEKGKAYTFSAGILNKIKEFDAAFFNISNREAAQMDPQQRLLLELTWEAFEEGGFTAEQMAGSNTGVYIGISGTDYKDRTLDDLGALDAYSMTGNTHSIAANRISYLFDLTGPSLAVDTACSSSLVALHQACQSLTLAESSMVIVGGINMLLHPLAFIGFSNASMLSSAGKCQAFSDKGDGYVRSEGASILILKPLEQAEADGDLIHAVILSSGINCDGKTSSLTIPSADKQQSLLESVYKKAQIKPDQIHYLEAHGTGTAVGDPIESAAIAAALGQKRSSQNPLLIGSVKTNIGHMETASGLAGLIKVVLALKNRAIPASLHATSLNKQIPFNQYNLQVNQTYQDLSEIPESLIMGVNSFGFGGANAHVVVKEYQKIIPKKAGKQAISALLILSARDEQALQDLAQAYIPLLNNKINYHDVAWSAYYYRTWFEKRALIYGTAAEIKQGLIHFAQNGQADNVVQMETSSQKTKLVFVFSGNGCQWQGMGRALFAENNTFQQAIIEVNELWQTHQSFSLIDAFNASQTRIDLTLTEIAQPLLFALQVGLVRVLAEAGIKPEAVVGHSVGEVASAWAAGLLSLSDAVWVLYERSQAQSLTKGSGRMAALNMSAESALVKIKELHLSTELTIAGINSPTSITLSGSLKALNQLQANLENNVFYRLLDLDYAFHSPQMSPIEQQILSQLKTLKTNPTGTCLFVSTVTGKPQTQLDNHYWWQNIRQPVEFSKALETLINAEFTTYIEIGAKPILKTYLQQSFNAKNMIGNIIPTLLAEDHRISDLNQTVFKTRLCQGPVNPAPLFAQQGQRVKLPSYPWQKQTHWYQKTSESYDLVNCQRSHPLLGYRLKDALMTWQNQLDIHVVPYLADHVIDSVVVFPAAAYIEMALAAAQELTKSNHYELENIEILRPITLENDHLKETRFSLNPEDGRFKIQSRTRLSDEKWILNTTGRILEKNWSQEEIKVIDLSPFTNRCDYILSAKMHYQLTKTLNLSYGAAFQGVKKVWYQNRQNKIVIAELNIPIEIKNQIKDYQLHPCLLDAGFQVLVDFFKTEIDQGFREAMIPIQLGQLALYQPQAKIRYVKAHLKKQSPRSFVVDFILINEKREIVAQLTACRFRAINFTQEAHITPAYYFNTQLCPRLDMLGVSPLSQQKLSNQAIAELVSQRFIENPLLQRDEFINETRLLIDSLVVAYIFETLQQFGIKAFRLEQFIQKTGILKKHEYLLRRLLRILEEEDLVITKQGKWFLQKPPFSANAQDIWKVIMDEGATLLPELLLLGRCGKHLPAVLLGLVEPKALLQPEKSSIQEHWLDDSMTFKAVHTALLNTVELFLKDWPLDKRFRIVVFGGKNASWVHQLIEVLSEQAFDLILLEQDEHVTDFINKSQQNNPHIKAFTVSFEQNKLAELEKFQAGFFDLMIVNHRLYEVGDLNQILQYLDQQLSSGGRLLITELQPDRFSDITLGLSENWWQYDSENNEVNSRLLNSAQWEFLLKENHYQDIFSFFEPDDSTQSGAVLYIATASRKIKTTELAFPENKQNWLIFSDAFGCSLEIANQLSLELLERGIQSYSLLSEKVPHFKYQKDSNSYHLNADKKEQFQAFWAQLKQQQIKLDKIVYLVDFSNKPEYSKAALSHQCQVAISLVQSITEAKLPALPQLNLISFASGAVCYHEEIKSHPNQAMLWGLGRVIMNEHKDLNCRLIDWQDHLDIRLISRSLAKEISLEPIETEVILSERQRYVSRMEEIELDQINELTDVCLDFSTPGQFGNLYWKALPKRELQADEIEIRPIAAGLNFRDIMYTAGLLADEAVENGFSGASLGLEFAGRIIRVGDAVTGFKVGDPVLGFAPACFSSKIITKTTAVALIPNQWDFEEAATVPTTFFTAYYALIYLAQLTEGEKILIHGASGGVGLAAIQIAQYLKLEIFATAGTDEKRDFVKMLGADHVMDSRSLKFADDIMKKTNGEGVDAVLNVIAGEAVNRNLSILKPFGRFLEIGKTDFYQNSRIGLRPFRNNISYFGIDADQLLIEKEKFAKKLFEKMIKLFAQGHLKPLPYRSFLASQVEEAFRYMNQSRHIGKIVISFQTGYPKPENINPKEKAFYCRKKSTYLITGGTQGFGLKTAEWLVKKGVESLVLVSRKGQLDPAYLKTANYLQLTGIKIQVVACDVTDLNALQPLINQIQASDYPLAGIIHAAMVLNDGLIQNMSASQFTEVVAPKAIGAWNLHKATENINLDCFLMYSSATTFLGNPGQGNYIAANLYLEALVNYRKQQGKKATFIAWGAIDDVGYLANNKEIKAGLQKRLGKKALNSDKALKRLETLLNSDYNGSALIDLDWAVLRKVMPSVSSRKYEQLFKQNHLIDEKYEDVKALIKQMNETELFEFIKNLLIDELSLILRHPKKLISITKPLNEIGMDSLMGMELVSTLETILDIKIPVMHLNDGANIEKVAHRIMQQLATDKIIAPNHITEVVNYVSEQQGEQISEEDRQAIVDKLDK